MSAQQSRSREPNWWDEEAWECFFRREDVRIAKFGELFDTLADHPDRDCIVMSEMGLGHLSPACRKAAGDCAACARRDCCELHDMRRLFDWPDAHESDPDTDDILCCFEEVKRMPVYQKAHRFAMLVQRYFMQHEMPDDPRAALDRSEPAETVTVLVDTAAMVPAQVAGGHGIGYEEDCICGNIANCKRALCNATRCTQALVEMSLPKRDATRLLKAANEVCIMLAGWIEELRSRVKSDDRHAV